MPLGQLRPPPHSIILVQDVVGHQRVVGRIAILCRSERPASTLVGVWHWRCPIGSSRSRQCRRRLMGLASSLAIKERESPSWIIDARSPRGVEQESPPSPFLTGRARCANQYAPSEGSHRPASHRSTPGPASRGSRGSRSIRPRGMIAKALGQRFVRHEGMRTAARLASSVARWRPFASRL